MRLRRHVTFANVTSLLALFVALGGTGAYAVASLTGADIVDESLTGADVRGSKSAGTAGSLRGEDVKDQSLTYMDLAESTIGTSRIVDESVSGRDIKDASVGEADLAPGVRGPRAYAHVREQYNPQSGEETFTFDEASSRNVASIVRVDEGQYCVELRFDPVSVMAVAQGFENRFPDVIVQPHVGTTFTCGEGYNAFVSTYRRDGGYQNAGFYIWFE